MIDRSSVQLPRRPCSDSAVRQPIGITPVFLAVIVLILLGGPFARTDAGAPCFVVALTCSGDQSCVPITTTLKVTEVLQCNQGYQGGKRPGSRCGYSFPFFSCGYKTAKETCDGDASDPRCNQEPREEGSESDARWDDLGFESKQVPEDPMAIDSNYANVGES